MPRTNIQRILSILAVILMMAVSLPQQAQSSQEDASVSFAFWGDPAEAAAYEEVIAAFEEQSSGIQVEAQYTPGKSDYGKRISTSFAGDAPPDVFLINYRDYGQYAGSGALEPLGTLFSNLPTPLVAPALMAAIALGFMVGIHAIPMVLLVDAAFPLAGGPSPALWAVAILLGVQCAVMITPFSSSVTMISRLTGDHPFEVGPSRNWRFCLLSAACGLAYLGLLSALLL